MQKSILFVSPVFVPYKWGGWVTQVALDYAKWLSKLWYNVFVITTLFDWLKKKENIDWINILRFWSYSKFLLKFGFYNPRGMYKWLSKNIKNFDLVFVHDIYSLYDSIVSIVCKKFNKPYFIMPHGMGALSKQKDKVLAKKIFVSLFAAHASKNANRVIFCSENEKNDYEIPYMKWEVITNWIDQKMWTENLSRINDEDVLKFRKKYSLSDKKIIFSMWRLVNVKRFDKTIKFLKNFLKEDRNYILLLVWPDCWEKWNLEAIVKDEGLYSSVKIIEWLFWIEKTILFKIWKLFVLSSDLEGFPIVICEAISSKIPCLLSSWCNVSASKWFVEIFNTEWEFQEKLKLLLENNSNINQEYLKSFDLNNTIFKLDKIITQVIEEYNKNS